MIHTRVQACWGDPTLVCSLVVFSPLWASFFLLHPSRQRGVGQVMMPRTLVPCLHGSAGGESRAPLPPSAFARPPLPPRTTARTSAAWTRRHCDQNVLRLRPVSRHSRRDPQRGARGCGRAPDYGRARCAPPLAPRLRPPLAVRICAPSPPTAHNSPHQRRLDPAALRPECAEITPCIAALSQGPATWSSRVWTGARLWASAVRPSPATAS